MVLRCQDTQEPSLPVAVLEKHLLVLDGVRQQVQEVGESLKKKVDVRKWYGKYETLIELRRDRKKDCLI